MEFYNSGNHGEQFGCHLNYEDFRITTPNNTIVNSPNQWTKIIDKELYHDNYVTANPNTLVPPVLKRFTTSFLLSSSRTDAEFYNAIVTIRVNIASDNQRVSIEVLPLNSNYTGSDNKRPAYNDLLRAYLEDKGSLHYNLKVYLRYPLAYANWRIKTLNTVLNDNIAYYFSYTDKFLTQNGLGKYPDTEYRRNQFLYIPQSSMSLIYETSLDWTATTAYALNDRVRANGNVYQCTVAGTTGTTAPSHTSGTATDGTITWTYLTPALPVTGSSIVLYSSVNVLSTLFDVKQTIFTPVTDSTLKNNSIGVNSTDYILRFKNNSGVVTSLLNLVSVPATPTSAGKKGNIAVDASYVYMAYNDGQWLRIPKDNTWT